MMYPNVMVLFSGQVFIICYTMNNVVVVMAVTPPFHVSPHRSPSFPTSMER